MKGLLGLAPDKRNMQALREHTLINVGTEGPVSQRYGPSIEDD